MRECGGERNEKRYDYGYDGSFVLELPEEATLVFSYIGYRSREIEYEGQLSLNVQLEDDARFWTR